MAGVGTFLGVALHKPLDSLSITTLMAARGWSRKAQLVVNLGYALMCPLGVLLAWAIGFLEPAHSHGGEEPAATGNPAKAGSAKAVPHDHAHDHDHDH